MPPARPPLRPATLGADLLRGRLLGLLLLAGTALRLLHGDERGSDVLRVTRAAIDAVQLGLNPYGHGYVSSIPPGAPFAYGPLALAWYALLPDNVELIASVVILLALALTGRLIGLAVCALWIPLAILANDGSNDTSAGLLLLGTLVLAERSPRLGAAALAGVVAFKPYALAFLPPLLAWSGLGSLVSFAAVSVLAWGPAIAWWGAGNIVASFRMAADVHVQPWFSLAATLHLEDASRPILLLVQLACGAVTSLASLLSVRSVRSMVAWGALIFVATLFTGWWSTMAYLAAVVPSICWHLDAWYPSVGPSPEVADLVARDEGLEGRLGPTSRADQQRGMQGY